MPPNDGRQEPFGPEASWSAGYSDVEYRDGDYRYGAPQAHLPAVSAHGEHPYAAFSGAGYGDNGYSDPSYQGPSAQDAGIAGTRVVSGFVEQGQAQPQSGYGLPPGPYPQPGYPQSGYPQGQYGPQDYSDQGYGQQPGYGEQPGYAGSSYAPAGQIEIAYPLAAPVGTMSPEAYHGGETYQQPWDYEQPLVYDDEVAYPGQESYGVVNAYGSGVYPTIGGDGAADYQSDGYNGSEYSVPGIDGPGYDLAGIIGTSDFEAIGYDEPSYDRLSYDDPRYNDPSGFDARGGGRFNETRFDMPALDESGLDSLWLPSEDARQDAGPGGYGNEGFTGTRDRSGYSPEVGFAANRAKLAQTRFDLQSLAAAEAADHTRFDVPAFDETRLDDLRGIDGDFGSGAASLLAPSADQPRSWAEETSLDHFADLDLTDEPVPAAFGRTPERVLDRPAESDTAARRAIGKRRGRSGDKRQWMALGAIAVVAAGAIGGVLMKYVFAGPSGPAHEVVAAQSVDGYTSSSALAKEMNVSALASSVSKSSSGQASDVVSAVYTQGSGASEQIFMFVGGKLASADPASSIANFEKAYPSATIVSAGSLGGEAACTQSQVNGQEAAMCVWFDNDTFGALVSPTMTTAKLATTLDAARPSLELYANPTTAAN